MYLTTFKMKEEVLKVCSEKGRCVILISYYENVNEWRNAAGMANMLQDPLGVSEL